MEIITKSPSETQSLGRKIGAGLKPGSVVALIGEMGTGKTTFIQGLAKGLKVKGRVNSPTFIIMRNYGNFYHVDLYRLETNLKAEVENLGLLDIISEGKSIVVIEWADRIKDILGPSAKWISIENSGLNERTFQIDDRIELK